MSRNGSGVYELLVNSWNPAVDGNAATTNDWQTLIDDIASALTQSVSADGQTPMTGDLNMNGNRLENMADGTANSDGASVGQIYSQGTEQDIASAATTDIGALNTNFVRITGTTTITSLGANYNGPKFVRFASALTLTHNATTLILPGGANITTAVGDRAIFVPKNNPANGWNCVAYTYATGGLVTGLFTTGGGLSISKTAVTSPVSGDGNVFSGTYTPTLTAVANIDSLTAVSCQYMRVGDVVSVSGRIQIDPTAAVLTQFRISLPIASNLAAIENVGGSAVAISPSTQLNPAAIYADAAFDTAFFSAVAQGTAVMVFSFNFIYRVI